MIDPSSSEEETDEEGVEEPHQHHRHHHHSQRAPKGQDASSSFPGNSNNTLGTTPGQLAGHGNINVGNGGNGAGAASSTAATSWGGGASNSLDVPPSSGSLPRYCIDLLIPFSSRVECLCPAGDKDPKKWVHLTPFLGGRNWSTSSGVTSMHTAGCVFCIFFCNLDLTDRIRLKMS